MRFFTKARKRNSSSVHALNRSGIAVNDAIADEKFANQEKIDRSKEGLDLNQSDPYRKLRLEQRLHDSRNSLTTLDLIHEAIPRRVVIQRRIRTKKLWIVKLLIVSLLCTVPYIVLLIMHSKTSHLGTPTVAAYISRTLVTGVANLEIIISVLVLIVGGFRLKYERMQSLYDLALVVYVFVMFHIVVIIPITVYTVYDDLNDLEEKMKIEMNLEPRPLKHFFKNHGEDDFRCKLAIKPPAVFGYDAGGAKTTRVRHEIGSIHWDATQTLKQCCGIHSFRDWEIATRNHKYYMYKNGTQYRSSDDQFVYPPSCCKSGTTLCVQGEQLNQDSCYSKEKLDVFLFYVSLSLLVCLSSVTHVVAFSFLLRWRITVERHRPDLIHK